MHTSIHEIRPRGTLYFPFQHYDMSNPNGNLFVTAHWHNEVEILYLKKGTLHLNLNAQMHTLYEGTICFLNSLHIHSMFPEDASTHYYAYVFPLEYLSFETQDYLQKILITPLLRRKLLFPLTITSANACYDELLGNLTKLIELDIARTPGYQLRCKSALLNIIAALYADNLLEAPTEIALSEKYKKIITYIEENYRSAITLEEIADFCNVSPKYFCRYFKNNFGKTFIDYLNHFRIEKACLQLTETSNSVIKIALDNGFHNVSYFNKCFKGVKEMTPSQYRAKYGSDSY